MDDNAKNILPLGWSKSSIGEVTLPVDKIDPLDDPEREIDYIDISSIDNVRNVVGEAKRLRLREAPSRARQIVCEGDVLFATVRPYLRNIAAVPAKFDNQIASTGFSVLRPASGIEPKFLFYKSTSADFVNALSVEQYGVSYPAVKDEQVRSETLALPSTNEQRRIVAKIEELFSGLDKGIESLKTAHEQLKVYRQAMLRDAFEGKLTSQWREENKDKPGSRSRAEPRPARELPSNLFVLPETWTWLNVKDVLSEDPSNGRSVKDRAGGFPVLRLTALKDGRLDLHERKNGDWERDAALPFLATKGDFLLSRGNGSKHLVGRGGVVPEHDGEVAYPDTIVCLKIDRSMMLVEFFSLLWNSRVVRSQIETSARTTAGIYKINQTHIKNYWIPVPCLDEQARIFFLLEAKLSIAEALETELGVQLLSSNALRQSILRKAFSGQLVAQDPSDEPASVLLGRIKAEKEDQANGKKNNKRKDAA